MVVKESFKLKDAVESVAGKIDGLWWIAYAVDIGWSMGGIGVLCMEEFK